MSNMKSQHQQRVEQFMRLASQDVPDSLHIPNQFTRRLRADLILEEAYETVEALGFEVERQAEIVHRGEPNVIEVIDGCCDLSVVTTGTLSAFGIPDEPFQQLVDENNLAKFGPGHSLRSDGKLIKPPGHRPPDIRGLIRDVLGVDV